MNEKNNPDPDNKPENPPKRESFSFQDLMADLGELPVADPKLKKKKAEPVVPPTRNRVGAMPESQKLGRPNAPKAIYDRPRPTPTEISSEATAAPPHPAPKTGAGQPAEIFFEDDRRKAIQSEHEEEAKRLEDLDRINSRVLGSSGYQRKPLWTTALLFAAVSAALALPNLGVNAYRDMFDPWLSFAVIFFGGITILISASGLFSEETWLGRVLCLAGGLVGAGACYLVYPNIMG